MQQPPLQKQLPNKFLTIEGGEGAGKSTLIYRLCDFFNNQSIPVVLTREPGGCLLGESIRQLLLQHDPTIKISPLAELLLFLAARAQHIAELIRPALNEGKIVLCDRFNDSTIAYQGSARRLDPSTVESLCYKICGSTLPSLTLLLDIDPRMGLQRAKASRKTADRLESETLLFHDRVRKAFWSLASKYPERISVIEANQPADQVFAQALKAIHEKGFIPDV